MSLTKAQLQGLNTTNFPNNTTGYITPALLREFNSQSVDSMALQTQVDSLSSSFQSQLNGLEDFSSSLVTNFATVTQLNASSSTLQANINTKLDTASFNTFSSSQFQIEVSQSQQISASFATASAYSASLQTSILAVSNSVSTSTGNTTALSDSIYQTDSTQSFQI